MNTVRRKKLVTYYTGEIIKLPYKGLTRKKHMKIGIRIKPRRRLRSKRRNRDRRKKKVARKARRRRYSRKRLTMRRAFDINHFSERKQISSLSRYSREHSTNVLTKHDVSVRRHSRLVYRSRARNNASFAPLDRLLVRRRQQCNRAVALSKRVDQEVSAVTSRALAQFTPKGSVGRVRRLYRVARRSRDLLRGARAGREGRQYRRKQWNNVTSTSSYLQRTARYFGRRFVEQVNDALPAAPLVFQRPTVLAVKTELIKKREFAASVADRESRFRFTAQYIESITQYIPALMSQLFSNRIKNSKLPPVPYFAARYLVRNIY